MHYSLYLQNTAHCLSSNHCMMFSIHMSFWKQACTVGFCQSMIWYNLTHWPLRDLNVILKIFNLALLIGIFKSYYDNVLRWMAQNLVGDKSTLVQVMAWCHQATGHNLNQCWPRSPMPYGVTRPHWVKNNGNSCRSKRWLYWTCDFLSLLRWKLNNVSKRCPVCKRLIYCDYIWCVLGN